ncbi:Variable outer membrane protein (plasmid) [Borrelia crocidurae DOU]|uniref:Variable large protein n=1 Tax=Borrelia crocidurae DOU TaxID=1293575 RepID=W5SPU6_9SPIR|nr:variable large family protein [Borrelia crocidurae]AHH07126.1 Variable outer membrane protein [Borrelia crocidurae DOU]
MMMMVMGCNSGGVGESKESVENRFLKSLVGLSNEFLNVFTSFGEMVGSVLGLKTDSKKSDVAAYFKTVQDTVQGIKDGLNKIVTDMKAEKNPNAEGVESGVKKFVSETLDKIIEGAKTVSEAIGDTNEPVGNVAAGGAGAAAGVKGDNIKNLVKGIKDIVDVVLKNEGSAEAGDDKKAENLSARTGSNATDGEAGKLFSVSNAGAADNAKKAAADAAKSVGAVTGADILKAMIKDDGDAVKLSEGVDAPSAKKDAVIAGGIALRAMAKGGKFAGPSDNANADAKKTVEGTAVGAVIKALDTLTVAIRKTMDVGLKSVKETMKTNINATTVASENSGSSSQNQ